MTQPPREPSSYTAADLTDPTIDAATLRNIAAERSDLWPQVLQHPSCYPGLADYIRAQQGPPQPQSAPQATEAPQQPPPAHTEQQGAGEHFAAGARQLAGGAKDYWSTTAAPAVSGAVKDVRANGSKSWTFWGRLAQPVIALLGFITLFFPAIRVLDEFNLEGQAENLAEELGLSEELSAARDELGLHTTQNFLTHDMVFIGVILLLLFLATIGLALASLVTNKAVLRLAAGGIGGVGGLVGIIVSIIYLVAAGEDHLTVGFGAVLMLILGILLITASAVALLPPKRATPPQPQQ